MPTTRNEPSPRASIPVCVLAIAADRSRRLTGHCLERIAAAKADQESGVGEACAVAAPAGVTGFAAVHCDADPVEAARVRAEARADLATPGFAAAAESGSISPMVRTMLATGTDDATRGAWLADSMRRAPAEAVQRLRAVSLGETPDAVPEHRAPVTDGWVPTADGGAGAWVFRTPVNLDAQAADYVSRAVQLIGSKRKASLAPVRAFGAIAEEVEKARWPASPGAFGVGHTFEVDPVARVAWLNTIFNPLQVPLDMLPEVPRSDERWRADGTATLRIVAQLDDGTPVDLEPGPLLAAFRGLAGDPASRRTGGARVRRPPRTWPDWDTTRQGRDVGGGAFGGAARSAPSSADNLARARTLLDRCDFDLARPPDEAAWAELLELAASSSRVGHALNRELCHALLRAQREGRLTDDEDGMSIVDGRRLPLTWRDARERIRVARALARLPWCDWVFARGEACYTKIRAVVAVATGVTDACWAGELRRRDVAIIEAMVARASVAAAVGDGAAGDAVAGPPEVRSGERPLWPIGRPVTLRCYAEITGDAGRALRRVRARLDEWSGRTLSTGEALSELCRLYLWTEGEPARDTVVYHHGPETRAASDPRRRLAPALARIEDALTRVLAAFPHLAGRFAEQGLALDATGTQVVRRPSRAERRRSIREAFERALAAVDASPDPRFVPALFRRLQEWRDGPRCRVPFCQNYLFVQYHHGVPVRLRSKRARLAADRGICSVCNAAEGAGLLVITPLPDGGIRVTDARGRLLGRRYKPGAHLDAALRARLLAAATTALAAGATPPVEPAVANARGDP